MRIMRQENTSGETILSGEVLDMKYEIVGQDKRYGMKNSYGKFDSLREATHHMNSLMISFGAIIKFKIKEVHT